jgi:uncharacterized protein (TIRG00374 family)
VTRWLSSRAARLIVAAALTAYVIWDAGPAAVVRAAVSSDLRWIALAIALVIVDRALNAYRWIGLLCPLEIRPPAAAILRVFFVSTFLGTFLPGSIGGDVVRTYGLARLQVSTGVALASVLMDRLLGVVSIVMAAAIGLIVGRSAGFTADGLSLVALVGTMALCAAAGAMVFSERAARAGAVLAGRMPFAKLQALGRELLDATRAYARYHGPLALVLAESLAVQGLRILQAYCLGRALVIDAPLAAYLAFVPLILLVILLPISINGLGTAQLAFVWFFGRAGVGEAQSTALSLLFLGLGALGNLPGGILYAFGPRQAVRRAPL